jgi:hypothetical protein
MNELNKLIEQYERENPGKKARWEDNPLVQPLSLNQKPYFKQYSGFTNDFVLWLASRPTCGIEQRKFLDEIEKGKYYKGIASNTGGILLPLLYIPQDSFESDLQKVTQGE